MNRQSIKENLISIGIFAGILLSIRTVFNQYLGHYWFGSVGIVSIIIFTLFYLSKKNKLGKLGPILLNRIFKRMKSKSIKLFMFQSCFAIYIFSLFTIGCLYSDPQITSSFKSGLQKQGITNYAQVTQHVIKNLPSTSIPEILFSILVIVTPNELLFASVSVINQFTNGWFLALSTLTVVEEAEILGIILYFRYFAKITA